MATTTARRSSKSAWFNFPETSFGRSIATVLAMLLASTFGAAGLTAVQSTVAPIEQAAAAGGSGTSSLGYIKVEKTASTYSLPAGGGSVTYTYKVTNMRPRDPNSYYDYNVMYYVGLSDDKCANISYQSGALYSDGYNSYIPSGGYSATFVCRTTLTQTTTNTVTAKFKSYDGTVETAVAKATVDVATSGGGTGGPGAYTDWCSDLYYTQSKPESTAQLNGSYGKFTGGTSTTLIGSLPTTSTYYANSSASATSVLDPGYIYYSNQDSSASASNVGIYKVNVLTGASTVVVGSSPATNTNRLAFDGAGTLWSFATNGHIYSLAKGSTTWVDHGVPVASNGLSFSALTMGDIAMDGLGNMWVLGSSGGAYLYTISASELSKSTGVNAQLVGTVSNLGGTYGLAFAKDGTLYASQDNGGTGKLFVVNKSTGAMTQQVSSANLAYVQDLGSCALPKPELKSTKTVSPTGAAKAGDILTYTIQIDNIGNLDATGVTLTDAIPANSTYVAGSTKLNGTAVADVSGTMPYVSGADVHSSGAFAGVIAPGASATVTFQVKVGTGTTAVCNQGNAAYVGVVAQNPDGFIPTDDPNAPGGADKTCTMILKPAIAIDKTADKTAILSGDQVTYSYAVTTGTGTEPLKSVAVTDDKCSPVTPTLNTTTNKNAGDRNSDGLLDPGETWQYTCTTALTTTTTNTATSTGTGNTTGIPVTATDQWTVTVTEAPAISLDKRHTTPVDVNANGRLDGGDTFKYEFVVTNTGNVALSNVKVTDPTLTALGITWTCPKTTLAPTESMTCTSGTYTIPAGSTATINNTATSTGTSPSGTTVTATDTDTITPVTASITLDKQIANTTDTNGNGRVDTGDVINYKFVVTNTGSTTLTGVTVSDPMVSNLRCPSTTLAPGATFTCTASYTIKATDPNPVHNSATVTGQPPTGTPVTATDTADQPTQTASITLDKKAGALNDVDGNGADAGDTITYTFVVTNTGSTTLAPVTISDAKLGLVNAACVATLAPGATATCSTTATYTLTQADVDARKVDNTAIATGQPKNPDGTNAGTPVKDDDVETVTYTPTNKIALDKFHNPGEIVDVNKNGLVDAGDQIQYWFTVTNTGATTLTNVTVTDPKIGAITCPVTTLLPGASTTCKANALYTITAADQSAGSVTNTATATGTGPDGGKPTATDSDVAPLQLQQTGLTLDKQAGALVDANGDGKNSAGDTITYTFVVKNTGNVTLAPVTVTDGMLGLTNAPCVDSLAPGATATCTTTKTYAITQADLNAGKVNNTAIANGTNPQGGNVPSNEDSTTTPLTQAPAIDLVKDVTPTTITGPGTVTYTFTITNTGNVTLNAVSLADPMLYTGTTTCEKTTLAPGEKATCSKTYAIDQATFDKMVVDGKLTNTATASGSTTTTTVTDTDPADVTPQASTSITLDKQAGAIVDANNDGKQNVGDTIAYTFVVTNTGTVTLTNVTVTDPKVGAVTCPKTTLAPGEQTICTAAAYKLTQADIDAGKAVNTATTTGTPPGTLTPPTADDKTETPITGVNAIALDKVAGNPTVAAGALATITDAGDTITYTFKVTNTGTTTLTNIVLTDDKVSGLSCPKTTLIPGESMTCTASPYVLTQADIDAASVKNVAKVTGTGPDGGTPTAEDNTETPTPDTKGIELTKTADLTTFDAIGQKITYTFTVKNTGNVTLAPVTITDAKLGLTNAACVATLAPGATATCTTTGTYTVQQADLNAGKVDNTATATGTTPANETVTDDDNETVTGTPKPAIDLVKTAGAIVDANNSGKQDAGDTIYYTFKVTNTGNVTLNPVVITDTKVGTVVCTDSPLVLDAGESATCTATYTLTQADVDAGNVHNDATATGTPPTGTPVTDTDKTDTPVTPAPAIVLTKSNGGVTDVDGNGPDAGDTVTYTFTVENTGNVTLKPVTVSDAKLGLTDAPCVAELAPGAKATCTTTGTYTLTQADVDAGKVVNTAIATGTPPTGTPVTDDDTNTVTVTPAQGLTLVKKTATVTTDKGTNAAITDAGDTISYTFTVTNTGGATMTNVVINDAKLGLVDFPCAETLEPGASATCTADAVYTITQADVDAGSVLNTALAKGTTPGGEVPSNPSDEETPITATPAIDLVKTVSPESVTNAGDKVTYTFVVTNTGNVTLTAVSITDPTLKLAGYVCNNITTLAPGASTTCTYDWTATQAQVDAKGWTNVATATGTPPTGTPVSDDDDAVVTATPAPAIEIVKDAAGQTFAKVGDQITYTFTITNTGNNTLSNVSYSDPLLKITDATCGDTTLAPKASTTCTATYTVTQADLDAGKVDNVATTKGTDPNGTTVTDNDPETVTGTQTPAITLVKTVAPEVVAKAGDPVTYTFVVTNSGNVALSNVVVTDPKVAGISCPKTTLAAGESMTCTAPYTATQADVDAGLRTNVATVDGTAPDGSTVTDDDDATFTVPATPALTLDKQASAVSDTNASGKNDAGDTITFTFVVTNTGNVTLTGVRVDDAMVAGITCPKTTLLPGESTTCTAPAYVITQADVDAGHVHNVATAYGTPPTGPETPSTPDETDTPLTPAPSILLEKTAGAIVDTNANGIVDAGDTVPYTFAVTNTGNVTLAPVTITDAKLGLTDAACVDSLAPGETKPCTTTGSHTLTQADVDAGKVDNTAIAKGTPPTGTPVTDDDTETVPVDSLASITLVKTAGDPTVAAGLDPNRTDAGDTVTYTFTITNSGPVTLTNVTLTDAKLGLTAITCGTTVLAPGAGTTCTADYVLTQADVNAGKVDNTASTTGTDPKGGTVTDTDDETVPVTPFAEIELTKTASTETVTAAGQVIGYTFTVKNTGTVTLTNVVLNDAKLGLVNAPCVATLEPGATATCTTTGSYTVTQGDIESTSIDNTASVTGTTPADTPVTDDDTETVTPVKDPKLALDKTGTTPADTNGSGQVDAGDVITYTFTVTNTGNVTLAPVTIDDAKLGLVDQMCAATLAPGAQATCTATYTLTQADVDAGGVYNVATATGTTPDGETPPVDDDHNTPIDPVTKLVLDKTVADASGNGTAEVGEVLTYTFVVTNESTVTINNLTVDETSFTGTGTLSAIVCDTTTLAPGAKATCTATYTVTQADVDAGRIDNTAVAHGDTPAVTDDPTTPVDETRPSTPVDSNPDSESIPTPSATGLTLVKNATLNDLDGDTKADLGETITFTFDVTNTGDLTLKPVTITDSMLGLGNAACADELAPGATKTCTTTVTYTVTQADVDRGYVANVATATGTTPGGDVPSNPDNTNTPTDTTATLVLDKTVADASGDGKASLGETLTFSFLVTNTGTVTLSNITVDDPMLAAAGVTVTCPVTELAPGASTTCTSAPYTVTAADVEAGLVVNTATAKGTTPVTPDDPNTPGDETVPSTEVPSNPDSTETPTVQIPGLSLVKKADLADTDGDGKADLGEVITFSFTVTNTGNVTLAPVTVSDSMLGLVDAPCAATLAPGATATCTTTVAYTVTQADVDRGYVHNVATATGTGPGGETPSNEGTTETPTDKSATLTLDKTVADATGDQLAELGETLTFSFLVTNTGTVTLTNVHVDDPMLAAAGVVVTCPVTTLAPGESTTCTASPYTVTAADVAKGSVVNTATAKGTTPGTPDDPKTPGDETVPPTEVPSNPDTTTTPVAKPGLALDKVATLADTDGDGKAGVGETITFTFDVTNTGDTVLTNVTVTDAMLKLTDAACVATLNPGEKATCTTTVTYTVTQADVDRGYVANVATTKGTTPTGGETPSNPDDTTTPTTQTATVSLDKTVADATGDQLAELGEKLTFSFLVTNTGTVTLTNVHVDDPMLAAAGVTVTCPVTTLAPGESTTCTSSEYTVTAADVAAGKVVNTATAKGTTPGTPDNPNTPGDETVPPTEVPSNPDTTTTPIAAPGLNLVKSATLADADADNLADVNETITFSFDVTNTGDTVLTNVTVTDAMLKLTDAACVATLNPGEKATCTTTVTYTVTQADVDRGYVANVATAKGTTPSGETPETPPSDTTTPTDQTATLSLDKQVADASGDGRAELGEVLTFTFVVKNTGTVTLTNVHVDDPMLAAAGVTVTCPVTTLAPGESTTCTASPYTVTAADVAAGQVVNTATAKGTEPGTPDNPNTPGDETVPPTEVPSNPDTTATPVAKPGLALDKVATLADTNANGKADLGEKITYSFVVTNTGDVVLAPVTISDPMLKLTDAPCVDSLAVGATATCSTTVEYTVTQADVDRGSIHNVATATGTTPGGEKPTDPGDTTTPTDNTAVLTLDKTAADASGDGKAELGEKIVFTFVVKNEGKVTLTDVKVDDPMLAAANVTVTCDKTTLLPGETATCTSGEYTVTAADMSAGQVHNVATAKGTTPETPTDPTNPDGPKTPGTEVPSNPDETTTPTVTPGIELKKTAHLVENAATTDGIAQLGEQIRFEFEVTNTGTTVLNNITVNDPMLAGLGITITCPVTSLEPGVTTICTASSLYTITAADVAAGKVANVATAKGTTPGGETPVTPGSQTETPIPSLSLDKQSTLADVNGNGKADLGEVITYSFIVTNTGGTALENVKIADSMLDKAGISVTCPATTLAIKATMTCSAQYTVTQADLDRGGDIYNQATAHGNVPGNPTDVPSNPDDTTTPTGTDPKLSLVKKAGTPVDTNKNGITDAGDQITFTFDVTNNGAVTLHDIVVSDPMLAAANPAVAITCPAGDLAPTATITCTASPYTITAADQAAGVVKNVATATGKTPDGTEVPSNPSDTETPVQTPAPKLVLDKQAALVDSNANGKADLGEGIKFSFVVTNTGNVVINDLEVVDPMLAGLGIDITCPVTTLKPGESTTCVAVQEYKITQADVDAGKVYNVATAKGTTPPPTTPEDPKQPPVVETPPDDTTTPIEPLAKLELVKKAGNPVDVNGDGITDAGDTVTYTFVVTNVGEVTLTNVRVDDPKLAAANVTITCPVTTLAPNESVECTSGAYTITAADEAAGKAHNVATAHGTTPDQPGKPGTDVPSNPDETDTPVTTPAPKLILDKTVSDASGDAIAKIGEVVTYTFHVTNAGNVPLNNVTVSETAFSGTGQLSAITCPKTTLAVGEAMDCTATYTVTAADQVAGKVTNKAIAGGETPQKPGTNVPSNPDDAEIPTPVNNPSLNLVKDVASVKDVNGDKLTNAGDQIVYSFTVTNNGNVDLSKVQVNDAKLAGLNIAISCPKTALVVGETMECTSAPYTVTAADEKAGKVHNVATATGKTPTDTPVETPESPKDVPVTPANPALSLVKSVKDANGNGTAENGEVLTYTFLVTNTGNVTVNNIVVNELEFNGAAAISAAVCPSATLAVGDSMECTATYTVQEGDLGKTLENTAQATGKTPDGGKDVPSNESTVEIPTPEKPAPALALIKSGTIVDANGQVQERDARVGDTIRYTFTVTNTGNVTLSGLRIDDPKLAGLTITCEKTTLVPGESTNCATEKPYYVVTEADADAGAVLNTAVAHGTTPGTPGKDVPSNPSDHVVPVEVPQVPGNPAMTIVKSAKLNDLNGDGKGQAGETISYSFVVTNTGDTDLVQIVVNDPMLANLNLAITCPKTSLVATEAMTCTAAPYTITSADEAAGKVHNVATATGKTPDGTTDVPTTPSETDTPTGSVPTPTPTPTPVPTPTPEKPAEPQKLARTGADASPLAALVLLAAGGAMLVIGRRRNG